jgi:hypothetical protein
MRTSGATLLLNNFKGEMNNVRKHPLERNTLEYGYFFRQHANGRAAYRRAVVAITGSLPTWAEQKKPGKPQKTSPLL